MKYLTEFRKRFLADLRTTEDSVSCLVLQSHIT